MAQATTMVPMADLGSILAQLVGSVNGVATAAGGGGEAFLAEARRAVAAVDVPGYVKIMLSQADVIIGSGSDKDVESIFSVLNSAIPRRDEAVTTEIASDICDAVASDATTAGPLRLRILANLYNALDYGSAPRFSVFLRVVDFAAASKQMHLMVPYFKDAASWVDAWGLTTEQSRDLFHTIASALRASGDSEQAHGFLLKFLETFEGASAGEMGDERVKTAARDAAVGFIKSATLSKNARVLSLAAVAALKGDATYGRLHELLSIFAVGTLSEYRAFSAGNMDYLKELGIDHEESLETIRLLSLCSLASAHDAVPFAAIASTLEIGAEDVEEWVVKAITAGLVDARIDELKKVVVVSRYSQREFGDENWRQLAARLTTWRSNVAAMLDTLQSGRVGARAAMGSAGAGAV